jgi:hypothetical protein
MLNMAFETTMLNMAFVFAMLNLHTKIACTNDIIDDTLAIPLPM